MAVKPGCFAIRRDQNLSPNQQLFEGATPETTFLRVEFAVPEDEVAVRVHVGVPVFFVFRTQYIVSMPQSLSSENLRYICNTHFFIQELLRFIL